VQCVKVVETKLDPKNTSVVACCTICNIQDNQSSADVRSRQQRRAAAAARGSTARSQHLRAAAPGLLCHRVQCQQEAQCRHAAEELHCVWREGGESNMPTALLLPPALLLPAGPPMCVPVRIAGAAAVANNTEAIRMHDLWFCCQAPCMCALWLMSLLGVPGGLPPLQCLWQPWR
jgi:hypothetical protein